MSKSAILLAVASGVKLTAGQYQQPQKFSSQTTFLLDDVETVATITSGRGATVSYFDAKDTTFYVRHHIQEGEAFKLELPEGFIVRDVSGDRARDAEAAKKNKKAPTEEEIAAKAAAKAEKEAAKAAKKAEKDAAKAAKEAAKADKAAEDSAPKAARRPKKEAETPSESAT